MQPVEPAETIYTFHITPSTPEARERIVDGAEKPGLLRGTLAQGRDLARLLNSPIDLLDAGHTAFHINPDGLEDGVDPRTGIDWSSKPDEMVARIRFAAQDGMLAGMSDSAIVAAYEGGDQHLVDRTKRRMKAAKADVESLLRGLRLSPPPADPRPSTLTDGDLQQRIAKAAVDLADRRVTKIDFLNKEFARDTDTDLLARRCAALARAAGYGAA